MTDDELIVKVDGLLAKIHQDILPNMELSRLIALTRIGAAVQPRPISEAIPETNCLVFDKESQQWGEAFRNSENERWYWAGGGPGEYVDMEIGVPDWFIPLSALHKPQEPT